MCTSCYSRRKFLKTIGLGAALSISGGCAGTRRIMSHKKKQPNVVLVITDDQGYGDLACHGNSIIETPNMDRLHQQSTRLTNFHVDPTCSPTRAALMTGRYSHRVGVWHTIMGRSFLRHDEVTMADVFRNSGYRTGIFGKWHLGGNYPHRPIDRGFDQWVGHGHAGTGTTSDYWGNDKMNDTYLRNGKWEKFQGFCTDIYFNEAMEFIDNNKEDRFFVYLATNVPHSPWNLGESWVKPYWDKATGGDLAYFYASITRVDYNLGRLIRFLEARGLRDNTIIIFLTDNGSSGGSALDKDGFVTQGFNAGMRGKKGSVYDGGHRVPCFICWPAGGIKPGKDIDRVTAHIDLLPTLNDLCGLTKSGKARFDGVSLLPVLMGDGSNWPDRTLIVESQRISDPVKWRECSIMTDKWRLINGDELYDIKKDPGQKNNVAGWYPEIIKKLRQIYEHWWTDVSKRDTEFVRPIIGSEKQDVTCLTSDDWVPAEGGNPWDQRRHILAGQQANGFWPVWIARDGIYEFSLRRWPAEVNRPISAALPAAHESDVTTAGQGFNSVPVLMGPGRALPIAHAKIVVGNADISGEVPEGACEMIFRAHLKSGPTTIQTWFTNEKGLSLGAYYVYVRHVG